MSLISIDGLHQLHILIFFLAVFHVLFSVITMTLGRIKVKLCFGFILSLACNYLNQFFSIAKAL